MKIIDSYHETQSSQSNKRDSSQIANVSRRRFLTTSGKVGLATAASIAGIGQAAGADTKERDLLIQGLGERATYSFAVSGNLEKDSYSGADIDDTDTITNNGASGRVENGGDAYTFTGDLLAFDLNGEAQVSLGAHGARVGNRPDYLLEIEGFGMHTPYSFSVEDNLQKSAAGDATISSSDDIVEQSAHGAVGSGTDAYTFDGSLHAFDFDSSGEVNVTLNGKPARIGQRSDHLLVIEGFGTNTRYSFMTSNYPFKSDAQGATIDPQDENPTNGAFGVVGGGKDAYTYDGHLRAFDFDRSGELRITIDGKPAHVGDRPDRVLRIFADGEYSPYEFSVSGSIREKKGVESQQDTINGKSVSGAVSGQGNDQYTFDGELTSLSFPGENSPLVHSNGERVSPNDV
ncbi:pre-peptidase [Halococcus sediminicola]|uniref:pre-peptidase n=1 Tax=Halococcus sediminicola TaxID=1264579 RepID=UPI000B1C5656|nr:pre-peptidase [Halococcus sediminicola]